MVESELAAASEKRLVHGWEMVVLHSYDAQSLHLRSIEVGAVVSLCEFWMRNVFVGKEVKRPIVKTLEAEQNPSRQSRGENRAISHRSFRD